jgi:hypothetical protein
VEGVWQGNLIGNLSVLINRNAVHAPELVQPSTAAERYDIWLRMPADPVTGTQAAACWDMASGFCNDIVLLYKCLPVACCVFVVS